MAIGDSLVEIRARDAGPRSSAVQDVHIGNVADPPVLAFLASANTAGQFFRTLPANYAGGDIRVNLKSITFTGTAGTVTWNVRFSKFSAGDNIATKVFAAAKVIVTDRNRPVGEQTDDTVTFTNAEADGLLAEGDFVVEVERDTVADASLAGNAELVSVLLTEA